MVNEVELKKIEDELKGAGKFVVLNIEKLFAIIERHLPGHMIEVKNFRAETSDLIANSPQLATDTDGSATADLNIKPGTITFVPAGEDTQSVSMTIGSSLGEPSSTASTSPLSSTPSTSTVNASQEIQTSEASTLNAPGVNGDESL